MLFGGLMHLLNRHRNVFLMRSSATHTTCRVLTHLCINLLLTSSLIIFASYFSFLVSLSCSSWCMLGCFMWCDESVHFSILEEKSRSQSEIVSWFWSLILIVISISCQTSIHILGVGVIWEVNNQRNVALTGRDYSSKGPQLACVASPPLLMGTSQAGRRRRSVLQLV